jgi:hypothetical protein
VTRQRARTSFDWVAQSGSPSAIFEHRNLQVSCGCNVCQTTQRNPGTFVLSHQEVCDLDVSHFFQPERQRVIWAASLSYKTQYFCLLLTAKVFRNVFHLIFHTTELRACSLHCVRYTVY